MKRLVNAIDNVVVRLFFYVMLMIATLTLYKIVRPIARKAFCKHTDLKWIGNHYTCRTCGKWITREEGTALKEKAKQPDQTMCSGEES
jgi:hypothetical protein